MVVKYESLQEDGALLKVFEKDTAMSRNNLKPSRNQSSLVDLSQGFALLSRPSKKEITLFQEQFYTLILNTTSVERKKISQNIATSAYTPKAIILFMAMQEIAIAQSPLLYSPVLQPSDLNLIIEKSSVEQAKVIARRENLDASNVKALLKLDNIAEQVKTILLANEAISGNSEIQEILETMHISEGWEKTELEITNIQSVDISPTQPSKRSKDLSQTLLALANKGGKLRLKPKGKPAKSTENIVTLSQMENQLLAIMREKNLKSFAITIQQFCGLKSPITFQILRKQNAGMLATLLRALEISDVSAARILLMANLDIGRNPQIFKVVMNKYKNLDHAECVSYYEKLGADFRHSHFKETKHIPTTRYALSLAARARRAALLKQQEDTSQEYQEMKLTA
jgi:uncharacterized protein (DUF2336 family)